jgi:predicted homoserine dehydrogenase-like protein
MDYATGEFMKENEVAIESGVKVELAESFLGGLSTVAEKFNVEVPAGKDDYLGEMESKVEDLQKRFDAVLEEKNVLEESVVDSKKEKIIDSKVFDLTESQKEEFVGVAEKVSYHSDEQFERAVEDLYESYFPANKSEESDTITEKLDEGQEAEEPKAKSWADELLSRV